MRGRRTSLDTFEGQFDNFHQKVEITSTCWLWKGYLNAGGYGTHKYKGKMWLAHRLAYFLFFGEFDILLDVCHTCDNPACVKPSHLWLGDAQANIKDMICKGRHKPLKGVLNHKSKLTEEQIRLIRVLHRQGNTSYTKLAAQFGVVFSTIANIVKGHTWPTIKESV